MITHETKIRVRYGDTDKMGYVYYGNYPLFYEQGRTELMRAIGMSYRQLEESGVMLPVQYMETEYLKPAFYDDLLTVKTMVREMPTARITFHYEIYNDKGELLNRGRTDLVFVNAGTMKPIRPPAAFLKLFERSL